jgi:hypothetical protein
MDKTAVEIIEETFMVKDYDIMAVFDNCFKLSEFKETKKAINK